MKAIIKFRAFVLCAALFFGWSIPSYGQTPNTSSISTNGTVNILVQDSANIYVGGSFSVGGYKTTGIAKINLNARSALDFPSVGGQCYASVSDGSGGWYVGGFFSVSGLSNLIHILSNYTIDISFAPNPNSSVRALYLDGSKLYVGGDFIQISNQAQNYLAVIHATTGVLQLWNPNPDGGINSINKDGNIVYVGGGFTNIGGRNTKYIAAIDASTASALPFISTNSEVNTIEQDANNLYVGGSFFGAQGYYTGSTVLLTTVSDMPEFNFL